jgi:mitochondrial fission protein ELM1
MMALADILVVTEDSISMISEAVSSGKKVVILSFGASDLPSKHRRFQEMLAEKSLAKIAPLSNLEEILRSADQEWEPPAVLQEEQEALQKKLQEIL